MVSKRILAIYIALLVLLSGCTPVQKDEDEIRRLANELYNLRKEYIKVKEERDTISREFETYKINYQLNQLPQDELIEEMLKTHMETFNPEGSLSHIFQHTTPFYNEEHLEYYGGILHKKWEEAGTDKFIQELSNQKSVLIDEVIFHLIWEAQRNKQLDNMKQELEQYEKKQLDNLNYKFKYVLYRFYIEIEEMSKE